jgi:hypothetical protein
MKKELLGLMGVALLAGPIAAHSESITYTYDFTVNGGPSGPLAGETATGSFSVDSSNTPANGGVLNATGLLTDFSFTWDGISYNKEAANTGALIISWGSWGPVFSASFGTNCDGGTCQAASGGIDPSPQWFVQVFNGAPGSFAYGVPGDSVDLFFGTATFEPAPVSVPEPGTVGVLGIGLGALFFVGRRRRPGLIAAADR